MATMSDLTTSRRFAVRMLALSALLLILSQALKAAEGPHVNVNTASAAELELLPRVGPVLAAAIIEHRPEGGYAAIDDLLDVPRIGEKTLELLRPFVVLEGETTATDPIPAPQPDCVIRATVRGETFEWTNPPGIRCAGTVTLTEEKDHA